MKIDMQGEETCNFLDTNLIQNYLHLLSYICFGELAVLDYRFEDF